MESEGSKNLNEARIIILGEKGAGKTCLARRLINPEAPMTEPNESTEGVVSTIWKIENKDTASTVNAHIWDFAGHVITHAAHRCFLSERCLYILVYDGRTERRNQIEYWLDHVRNYGGNAPVLILINMFDNNKPDIPINTLRKKYPFIRDFVYFSIKKDKDDLEKFSAETTELILNNLIWNSQNIPLSYYKVKNALRELFDNNIEYISKEQFYKKASENYVTEEKQNVLLEHLHCLGICLWYKDIEEFGGLVLNPDWITNGIYKVINWAHNKSKSTIFIDDFYIIFNDEKKRYPKEKFRFILELMKKYELAYSKNCEEITIPHILREDQPDELPDFPIEESLMLKYISEQPLPPNMICRLIVRHHREIQSDSNVWRYGVVLKYKNDTIALVYEDDRKIVITVKGNNKSEYISELRNTMNEIFKSYKSQKPELQYRLIVNEPIENNNEGKLVMISDEDIVRHIANKKYSYYYSQANLDIPLDKIITNYNIQIDNIKNLVLPGGNQTIIENIKKYNDNNLRLQGDFNSLIGTLDPENDSNFIEALKNDVISNLKKAEILKSIEEVKKSGLLGNVGDVIPYIRNENSQISQISQKIEKDYDNTAQSLHLPKQVQVNEKIIIENFFTIAKFEWDVKEFNILTGGMASGKSLSLKLLYFCEQVFHKTIFFNTSINKELFQKDNFFKNINYEFGKIFSSKNPKKDYIKTKITYSYNVNVEGQPDLLFDLSANWNNTELQWSSKYIESKLETWQEFFDEQDNSELNQTVRIRVFESISSDFFCSFPLGAMFIPASRAIASITDIIRLQDPFIEKLMELKEYALRINDHGNISSKEVNNLLKVENISLENGQPVFELKDLHRKRKITSLELASGQQQLLYLLLLIHDLRRTKSTYDSHASMFAFSYHTSTFIEEPSAHLFPMEQRKTIEFLVTSFNKLKMKRNYYSNPGDRFFISTHSPYLLNTINNLMEKDRLLRIMEKINDSEKKTEINEKITALPFPCLSVDNVSAYMIKDKGEVETMINKDANEPYIYSEVLDQISQDIKNWTEKLYDINIEVKKIKRSTEGQIDGNMS
jgi:GTPase SAR1 family protein